METKHHSRSSIRNAAASSTSNRYYEQGIMMLAPTRLCIMNECELVNNYLHSLIKTLNPFAVAPGGG